MISVCERQNGDLVKRDANGVPFGCQIFYHVDLIRLHYGSPICDFESTPSPKRRPCRFYHHGGNDRQFDRIDQSSDLFAADGGAALF